MKRTLIGVTCCAAIATGSVAVSLADTGSAPTASAAAKVTVPKLHCRRLDVAEDIVRNKGLRVVERGGGTFGIVVKSNWVVGSQRPAAGARVAAHSKVYLYAAREC